MSRHTEHEHTTPQKADPDAGLPPRATHRTSLTGLRRVAEAHPAGKLATATAAEQRSQHGKAESASFGGIQAALAYGAASIHGLADAIEAQLRSNPGDGGPMKIVTTIEPMFAKVRGELSHLSFEASTQEQSNVRRHLAPEAKRVAGAVDHFKQAWEHAKTYAAQHGEKLGEKPDQNPHHLKQLVEGIYEHIGLDKTVAADQSPDKEPVTQRLKETIRLNLDAAGACAQAVRMGMATGDGGVLQQDHAKLIGHLTEVHFRLKHADPAVARSFKETLRAVLAAVKAIKAESGSRPAIAQSLANGDVSRMIENLAERAR
jgi:hypothetical protein